MAHAAVHALADLLQVLHPHSGCCPPWATHLLSVITWRLPGLQWVELHMTAWRPGSCSLHADQAACGLRCEGQQS